MATAFPPIVPEKVAAEDTAGLEIDERGRRPVVTRLADGREVYHYMPLTPADYLDPEEGDQVPEDTFHRFLATTLEAMLRYYLAHTQPHLTVFGDLVIRWADPKLKKAAPDVAVIPNVKNPGRRRGEFKVAREGTSPILFIEVVSNQYRREDRIDKVKLFEQIGVPEYFIFDQRLPAGGQVVEEVLGYRLQNGHYQPIAPDGNGLVLAETVGLRFGLTNGRPVIIEAASGKRLLTLDEKADAHQEAEVRLAVLEAEIKKLRGER